MGKSKKDFKGKFMNTLQKTLIERYTEKKFNSHDFTYRDYLNLRRKLNNKNARDTQKQTKAQEKIAELTNAPKTRNITPLLAEQIYTATAFGSMAIGATIAGAINEPALPVYESAIAGLLFGSMIGGFGNIIAYANKPLTNAINKTIIKAKDRKVRKLEDRKELRNYTLYCFRQQERDNTPSYEDFLNAVKENDTDLTM